MNNAEKPSPELYGQAAEKLRERADQTHLPDAGALGFRFPARRIRLGEVEDAETGYADFALFGPTSDSADRMRGPFRLPADMREGDWIELGQLGAYGACLRTGFNGFGRAELVAGAGG
jgi:ornithine decarboxylase